MKISGSYAVKGFLITLLSLTYFTALPQIAATEQPQSSAPTIPSPTVIKGTLEVLYADYFETDRADLKYRLHGTDGRVLDLHFTKPPVATLRTGQQFMIRGELSGSDFLVEPRSMTRLKGIEDSKALVTGSRSVAVMIVRFADRSNSCSNELVTNIMWNGTANVREFFEATSNNLVTIAPDTDNNGTPDVFGPLTIPYKTNSASCNPEAWAKAADAAATAAGVNLQLYKHRLYVLPQGTGCRWAGLGHVGCNYAYCQVWVNGKYCSSPDIYSHELGHNLGMSHASTDANNDGKFESEYGDNSCTMGYGGVGWRHFNSVHQDELGWIESSKKVLVSKSGTFELASLEVDGSSVPQPQIIKIGVPGSSAFYYISYRLGDSLYNTNLYSTYRNRLSIHRWSGKGNTALISNPAPGATWTEKNGIKVAFTGQSENVATVTVTIPCISRPPTAVLSTAQPYINSTSPLTFNVSITNNDIECPSTTFSLKAAVSKGMSYNRSTEAVTLAPGEQGEMTLTVSPYSTIKDGKYSVSISAIDSDNISPKHTTVSKGVNIYLDRQAPYTPPWVQALPYAGQVLVYWGKTADRKGGVGLKHFEVYRNGELLGTVGAKMLYALDNSTSPGALYTYSIIAVDYAGNRSGAREVSIQR